jgi:hypothetical protein
MFYMEPEKLTLVQLAERFGKSTERRVELFERLNAWLEAAQATQMLRRVWVFGSFASGKPGPRDVDILALFAIGFDPANLPASEQHWFEHEVCYQIHEIDLYFMTETTTPEVFTFLLEGFRYNRTGEENMVEVEI